MTLESAWGAFARWLRCPNGRPSNLICSLQNRGLKYELNYKQVKAGTKIARLFRTWNLKYFLKNRKERINYLSFLEDIRDQVIVPQFQSMRRLIVKIRQSELEWTKEEITQRQEMTTLDIFYNREINNVSNPEEKKALQAEYDREHDELYDRYRRSSTPHPCDVVEDQLVKIRGWAEGALEHGFLTKKDSIELNLILRKPDSGRGSPVDQGIAKMERYFELYTKLVFRCIQRNKESDEEALSKCEKNIQMIDNVLSATPENYQKRLAYMNKHAFWLRKPSLEEHYLHMAETGKNLRETLIDPLVLFWGYSPDEEKFANKIMRWFGSKRKNGEFPDEKVLELLSPKVIYKWCQDWEDDDKKENEVPSAPSVQGEYAKKVSENANDPELKEAQKRERLNSRRRSHNARARLIQEKKEQKREAFRKDRINDLIERFGVAGCPDEINAVKELVDLGYHGPTIESPTVVLEDIIYDHNRLNHAKNSDYSSCDDCSLSEFEC